jgi:hypothetical protein
MERAVAGDAGVVHQRIDRAIARLDVDAIVEAGLVIADVPANGWNAVAIVKALAFSALPA